MGQTARQYTAGLFDSDGNEGCRKVQTVTFTVSNRLFYKELEEGAYNIVDVKVILLA